VKEANTAAAELVELVQAWGALPAESRGVVMAVVRASF